MKIYNDNLYINTKASKITKTPLHNQQPKILRQNNHRQPQTVLNFQSKTAWSASAKLLDVSSNSYSSIHSMILDRHMQQTRKEHMSDMNSLSNNFPFIITWDKFHLCSYEKISKLHQWQEWFVNNLHLLSHKKFPQLDQTSKNYFHISRFIWNISPTGSTK